MAWTAPRTWVDTETPTASIFNTHIRDNTSFLKTSLNADGKLIALSSDYVADLDATNITSLARTAQANDFTAGRTSFNGGTTVRFIVPVGTDKYDGTAGNKTAGSIWIEGNYIHHVDSIQREWRFLGAVVSSPASADPGSVWVDSTNTINYIDASGVERRVDSTVSPHTDTAAVAGSPWIETYLHWTISGGVEYQGHVDVAHGDYTDHTDSNPHSDSGPYSDYTDHVDAGYGHSDHQDGHGDHNDHTAHADVWPYTDYTDHSDHDDHTDSGPHSDHTDHGDHTDNTSTPADSRPELIGT